MQNIKIIINSTGRVFKFPEETGPTSLMHFLRFPTTFTVIKDKNLVELTRQGVIVINVQTHERARA